MLSQVPNLFLSRLSQESEHLLASHSVAVSLPCRQFCTRQTQLLASRIS